MSNISTDNIMYVLQHCSTPSPPIPASVVEAAQKELFDIHRAVIEMGANYEKVSRIAHFNQDFIHKLLPVLGKLITFMSSKMLDLNDMIETYRKENDDLIKKLS